MPKKTVTGHRAPGGLRWPAFITLALSPTTCARCPVGTVVLAAVIDGLDRHLDPLPLSLAGLTEAVTERRYVAVVRPIGPPLANEATPGHWWVTTSPTPTLLASHVHGQPLPHDPGLASALLARFLPALAPVDPDAPCPF